MMEMVTEYHDYRDDRHHENRTQHSGSEKCRHAREIRDTTERPVKVAIEPAQFAQVQNAGKEALTHQS